jgi:RNA polymerase sigma-70 factor (ECF subfamily)
VEQAMVVVPFGGTRTIEDEANLDARAQLDRDDFALLYRQHLPDVYRYCYRRLRRQDAAEDATSQIFAQALAGLPRFHGGSFRAWLFTIAHHVVVDEMRKMRPASPLDDADTIADPGPSLDDQVIRDEAGQTLMSMMSHLSPTQRQVLELRLAGLTAVEIAEVMGRSHGTIRNMQHQTLARMRELLARQAEIGESCDGD